MNKKLKFMHYKEYEDGFYCASIVPEENVYFKVTEYDKITSKVRFIYFKSIGMGSIINENSTLGDLQEFQPIYQQIGIDGDFFSLDIDERYFIGEIKDFLNLVDQCHSDFKLELITFEEIQKEFSLTKWSINK
jgi:hypothetical protein